MCPFRHGESTTVSITKNEHGKMTMHVSMGYSDIEGGGTFFTTEVNMDEVISAMVNAGYTVEPIPPEKTA